jgi:hypothetical protein
MAGRRLGIIAIFGMVVFLKAFGNLAIGFKIM